MVRFLTSSDNMSTTSFFVLHFVLIYNFIYTTANYNMAGINFIDKTDLRVLNFGPVVKNKVLNTSIFAVYEGKTRKQCIFACTSTSGCVSYNFGSNGGICQLCSEEADSCVFVSKPGFIHQGIFVSFSQIYTSSHSSRLRWIKFSCIRRPDRRLVGLLLVQNSPNFAARLGEMQSEIVGNTFNTYPFNNYSTNSSRT
jgi:hypothetical protein